MKIKSKRTLSVVIIIISLVVIVAISQHLIKPAFGYHCGHHHIDDAYNSAEGPCPVPVPEEEDPCNVEPYSRDDPEFADWKQKCIPEHEPLRADSGADQKVTKENQVILLNGKGIGGTGELKYKWTKIEGPSSVVLGNPNVPNPSFVFPTSEEFDPALYERRVVFKLEVTDGVTTGEDTVEIKDSCFIEDKPFKTYSNGPWSFKYGIVEKEGLVLKDIRAGKELLFDSISVPHFRIVDSAGNDRIIRFCDPSSPGRYSFSPDFPEEPVVTADGISNLQWDFSVNFEEEYGDKKGALTIVYDIAVVSKELDNCEVLGLECYRFVPKVSYRWYDPSSSDPLPPLKRFAAFYRLDYGSDIGLARVRDGDTFGPVINTAGEHPMITHEVAFLAVNNGQPGDYDNIHTAHSNQGIFIPGCRYLTEFDCIHMHWRWPKFPEIADPMVEPSTGKSLSGVSSGTPHLVRGQTIAIAIVKDNPGEEDPDDISTLLNPPEQIAIARPEAMSKGGPVCNNCVLDKGGDPIVWYVASVSGKIKDTFFRHGFFVLDSRPGDPSTADGKQFQDPIQQGIIDQNGKNVQSELKGGGDEEGNSNSSPTASSSISTSLPTNSLPIASFQTVNINGNTPVEITLSASDLDVTDDLTAIIVTPPSNGTLGDIDQTTGIVTYTPNPGSNGYDNFGFKVNDGKADSSNIGIVEIIKNASAPIQSSSSSLTPVSTDEFTLTEAKATIMNTPPTGQNQDVETSNGTHIDIKLAAIDPDEGDDLTATVVTPPLYGNLSAINQQTGVVTYTPIEDYKGYDRFSFNVNDGKEDSINDAIVMIKVG